MIRNLINLICVIIDAGVVDNKTGNSNQEPINTTVNTVNPFSYILLGIIIGIIFTIIFVLIIKYIKENKEK